MDSQNSSCQAHIVFELTWSTRVCETHVFSFFVYLLDLNANLGEHHFGGVESVRPMLDYRGILFWGTHWQPLPHVRVYQIRITTDQGKQSHSCTHSHQATQGKNNVKHTVRSKSKYSFNYCDFRIQLLRTYFRLSPGILLSTTCFVIHCKYIEI